MPPYDFFQQIQYIPVYLSPPPDNWGDYHFYIKTFGPGVVTAIFTGTIAIFAYRVARTQRTIAANKYALDLFDKRYEIFDSMIKTHDKITKFEILDYDRNTFSKAKLDMTTPFVFATELCKVIECIHNFMLKEFKDISSKLEKSARIFQKITKNDVERFKKVLHEFEDQKNAFFMKLPGYPEYDQKNIKKHFVDICIYGSIHNFQQTKNFYNNKIESHISNFENGKTHEDDKNKCINIEKGKIDKEEKKHKERRKELCQFDKELYELILKMIFLKESFIEMYDTMNEYLYISEKAY